MEEKLMNSFIELIREKTNSLKNLNKEESSFVANLMVKYVIILYKAKKVINEELDTEEKLKKELKASLSYREIEKIINTLHEFCNAVSNLENISFSSEEKEKEEKIIPNEKDNKEILKDIKGQISKLANIHIVESPIVEEYLLNVFKNINPLVKIRDLDNKLQYLVDSGYGKNLLEIIKSEYLEEIIKSYGERD